MYFLKILFIYFYVFILQGREGEREGEKHQCVVASRMPCTGDLACSPGMFPDGESNWQPFGSQAGTQSTEPHQAGRKIMYFLNVFSIFQLLLTFNIT